MFALFLFAAVFLSFCWRWRHQHFNFV